MLRLICFLVLAWTIAGCGKSDGGQNPPLFKSWYNENYLDVNDVRTGGTLTFTGSMQSASVTIQVHREQLGLSTTICTCSATLLGSESSGFFQFNNCVVTTGPAGYDCLSGSASSGNYSIDGQTLRLGEGPQNSWDAIK